MTEPSSPALMAIWRAGADSALRTISTPVFLASFWVLMRLSCSEARSRATPPPGRMPSSTAARVACIASSTRSLRSLTSISVAPPTRITPTPPARLASRHPAREFGETLLQLFLVVVRGRLLDLRLDLGDSGFDVSLLAATADDGGVF